MLCFSVPILALPTWEASSFWIWMVSLMMGVWFACTAVADYLSGQLERICHDFHINLWTALIATSIGAGIVLMVLTPILKKWMHGKG